MPRASANSSPVRKGFRWKPSTCATTTEIADELHIQESKVEEVLKIAQEPVSLEAPIGEEEDSHLGVFIQDDEASQPSEEASYTLLREQLEEVLSTLTPREEQVLRMRFGLPPRWLSAPTAHNRSGYCPVYRQERRPSA